jgi:hypothetical protein
MMDGSATLISWSLIVDVETPSPHGKEDVSRPAQFVIKNNLGTHVLAPPFDSRVGVACKQMSMMVMERHDSFPSVHESRTVYHAWPRLLRARRSTTAATLRGSTAPGYMLCFCIFCVPVVGKVSTT